MAKNFIKLDDFSFFYYTYVFFDTDDYLADRIFINKRIRIKYGDTYNIPGDKYEIIICKVKKKDEQKFLEGMEELSNKMALMGYDDYDSYCEIMSVELVKR